MPQQKATVRVFDCAFFRKIITRHDTGLGESYMDRDFEVSGLTAACKASRIASAAKAQGCVAEGVAFRGLLRSR